MVIGTEKGKRSTLCATGMIKDISHTTYTVCYLGQLLLLLILLFGCQRELITLLVHIQCAKRVRPCVGAEWCSWRFRGLAGPPALLGLTNETKKGPLHWVWPGFIQSPLWVNAWGASLLMDGRMGVLGTVEWILGGSEAAGELKEWQR